MICYQIADGVLDSFMTEVALKRPSRDLNGQVRLQHFITDRLIWRGPDKRL